MTTLGAFVSSVKKHSLNIRRITQAHFSLLLLYNLNPVKDATLFGLAKIERPHHHGSSSKAARKAQKVQVVKQEAKSAFSKSGNQTNYHRLLLSHNYLNYAPPVLASLYVIIESLVILSRNGFRYSPTSMPRFFSHRFMLKTIWQIGDAVVFMALANSVYVFTALFFDTMFSPKLVMYLFEGTGDSANINNINTAVIVQNGKALNAKTSAAIATYYRKTGSLLRTSFTIIFINCQMYINLCMYQNLTRSDFRRTWYDTFMWVIVVLDTSYIIASVLFFPFFFFICAQYVQIKQKLLRASFQKLQAKVIVMMAKGGKTSKSTKTLNNSQQANQPDSCEKQVAYLWNKLNSCNREMASLFGEIRLYNRFWAKYITSFFLICCLEVCYFAFILLIYSSTIPGYQTFVFSFVALLLLSFLVFLTFLCSTLVYRSARLARQAQQVAMMLAANSVVISNFQSASSASFWHYRHLSGLFKVDQMAANYRNIESVSAFRLSVGYEINSKMFQMLFTYTSLYFMMILGGYYKNSSGEVAN